jgi:hypothetical protein
VLQVFVANPKKPAQIETILRRNKDKLLVFLRNFHNDKEGAYILSSLAVTPFSVAFSTDMVI